MWEFEITAYGVKTVFLSLNCKIDRKKISFCCLYTEQTIYVNTIISLRKMCKHNGWMDKLY